MKKYYMKIKYGAKLILGIIFALLAAPIIYLSRLDRVDDYPSIDELKESARYAESLKKKP